MAERLIQNVSDTARWVAAYRERETQRRDPLFRIRKWNQKMGSG